MPDKPESVAGHFKAKYVPLLANVINTGVDALHVMDGIQVEPHEEEGVWLMATSPSLAVWIHDASGHASEPFVLDVCIRLVRACEPPIMPELLDCNGDAYDVRPPDWATPERVTVLFDKAANLSSRWQIAPRDEGMCITMVQPAGVPRRLRKTADSMGASLCVISGRQLGETQAINRKLLDWRKQAFDGLGEPIAGIRLDLQLLSVLAPLGKAHLRFQAVDERVLIDFPACPEIHAVLMPLKQPDDLPAKKGAVRT